MDIRNRVLVLAGILLLAACGGGGGSRGTPPPEPPPAPAPPPPPPPTTCTDPDAENTGGPLPCVYANRLNHLVPTGVADVQQQGLSGEGVGVGFLDTTRSVDPYAALSGQIAYYRDHTGTQSQPDDPAYGHGDTVGSILAGNPVGDFPGGVAPGAQLHWAAVCNHFGCLAEWQADGVADLAGRDIRIISASIGTGRPLDTSLMDVWREIYQPVLESDILFVIATGNSAGDHPQPVAVLPQHAEEYREHWITVTGVDIDPDTGEATGLHPWSNACGHAAAWCIAAPTSVSVPSATEPGATLSTFGTSFATPIVSGTAALVAEAYPWMTASNLQTTVLTTASDIGEPGVDDRFGWGLIDARKAVRGPGRFVVDFVADVPSGVYEFGNAISGDGGLLKAGAGSLLLSQANTYTGATWINSGQLELTGSVAGDVFNLDALLSRGGLIGGNYTASADSMTRVEVGAGLQVGGTASFAGELNLLAPADGRDPAAVEQIIGASHIEGTFANVSVDSGFFYSAELDYTDTSVLAQLTRTSAAGVVSSLGLPARMLAGAQQADLLLEYMQSSPHADSPMAGATQRLVGAAHAGHASLSLASLTGEVHATLRTLGFEQTLGDSGLLADRIANLPAHQEGRNSLAMATGRSGMLSGGGYSATQLHSSGVLVGGYTDLPGRARVGVALTGSTMQGQLDELAGVASTKRHGLAVFARHDHGQFNASAILGVDRLRADTRRSILLGERLEGVLGDRNDQLWHGRLEGGWTAAPGIAPFVALGMARHVQGRLRESGAAGLGLSAARDTHDVGFGELGVRMSRFDAAGGRLGVLLAGRWLVSGREAGFPATFAGAPDGVPFDVAGQALPGFRTRAGLSYSRTPSAGWQAHAELGAELSREGLRSAGITLGLGRRF